MGYSKICHNNHTLLRPSNVPVAALDENPGYQSTMSRGRLIAAGPSEFPSTLLPHTLVRFLLFGLIFAATSTMAFARLESIDYEGRRIASVEVVFEGTAPDAAAQASLLSVLKVVPNTEYSAVRVRESLQELFDTQRVANARVEIIEGGDKTGPIGLRFVVTRQVQIGEVVIDIAPVTGTPVSQDEIRARLNLTQPGSKLTKQIIVSNADEIQVFLRDRGYYNATVEPVEKIDASGTSATVTYRIVPGEQAKVAAFNIDIKGFDALPLRPTLSLHPGAPFTREALGADMKRITDDLIAKSYLAPQLTEPRIELDAERNQITISVEGALGPKTDVVIKGYPISEKTKRELLPVMREGNLDVSAITEGGRRLRNKLQEEGFFFADVTAVCTVTQATPELGANGTAETCNNLNPEVLSGRSVEIAYQIEQGRRFKLTDIRITGTNKVSFEDIEADLRSQKASALGLIPFVSYGRGYTSLTLLEQDKRTVRSYMRDIGYRHAEVDVLQGVSVNGENLIITFNVTEGPLTRIAGVEVRGNKIYTEERLREELKTVIGAPFSRSQARFDSERVMALYSREGYVNAHIVFSADELPKKGDDEQVRLVYTIVDEGEKVFINRIIVNGVTGSAKTQRTKRDAIVRAIPLEEGDVLRADRIAEGERELYLTDAYRQVLIRTEPAGETASGFKKHDVIIDVEEKKPRVMDYGGGYSTDIGALGLLEISNVNFMNKLRQGAMRLRMSQRTQLLRFEFLDPRFARYGKKRFAPLALSVEYQRDSTVTRFFRSAIDRGTFGIVQRLDEDGNPIDDNLMRTDEPTINRFIVKAETQRVLDQKTKTIAFARYTYEDVRLFNLQSLIVKPILQPDRAVRLSRFGASLVRDTREKCERGFGVIRSFDDTEPGAPGEICRYNQVDATRGSFFSMDYAIALRELGGNLSFHKLETSYRRYYKLNRFRGTVLAGNATLGLAHLFNPRDRDDNGQIDEIDLTLPISERFFSGGATSIRGFGYEEAGPREVIIPTGVFRDRDNNPVLLNPFTVPVGGNAMAVVNLEARVPLTRSVQAVPFYDGGNVFRRVGDLFKKQEEIPITPGDTLANINAVNRRAHWTHTVGLGFRFQTPLGGALAIDYAYLLNPPSFLVPQRGLTPDSIDGPPAVYRVKRTQIHFRFTQTF